MQEMRMNQKHPSCNPKAKSSYIRLVCCQYDRVTIRTSLYDEQNAISGILD